MRGEEHCASEEHHGLPASCTPPGRADDVCCTARDAVGGAVRAMDVMHATAETADPDPRSVCPASRLALGQITGVPGFRLQMFRFHSIIPHFSAAYVATHISICDVRNDVSHGGHSIGPTRRVTVLAPILRSA